MSQILVLGGAGEMGSVAVADLVANTEHEVLVGDVRPDAAAALLQRIGAPARVTAVDVISLSDLHKATQRFDCDLVCVSGGWNPAVHLFSQARGKLRYDETLATFVPDKSPWAITPAGAANGRFGLAAALADGHAAGVSAAAARGYNAASVLTAPHADARCFTRTPGQTTDLDSNLLSARTSRAEVLWLSRL